MNNHTLKGGGQVHSDEQEQKTRSVFSRFLASLVASVMALAGLVAVGPAAYAEAPGIAISTLHNGNAISGGEVVEPGDTFTLRVQYNGDLDASEPVVIGPPQGLAFDESTLDVSNNEALENAELVDGDIHLTFHDPQDWDVNQGVWDLNFTFDEVEHTESQTVEWTVNGTPYSRDVIVTSEGAEQEQVSNHLSKNVNDLDLSGYVSAHQGVVSIDPEILQETFEYTLTVHSDRDTERGDFTIQDELSQFLAYDETSFEANITTWDDIGWNAENNPFDFDPQVNGNSFEYSGTIPNPSELTVTYSAAVMESQLDELTAVLQEEYDALDGAGSYTFGLDNTVTFGDGTTSDTTVNIGGTREEGDGPTEVTDYLNKSASNTDLDQFVSFDQSGQVRVDEAILEHQIDYTLDVHTADAAGRDGFSFEDDLSEYLAYDRDSFQGEITTWDESGWNADEATFDFTPEFSDNGFTITEDIAGRSELTITYSASVAADQLDALTAALQEAFDDLGTDSGDYRVALNNSITFGGESQREAEVSVGNTRADGDGPENVSDYLNKNVGDVNLSQYVDVYEGEVRVNEEILDESIDYTLQVNTDRQTVREDYTVEDDLSEFLSYDQESFDATITTWDENGWNAETEAFQFDPEFSENGFTFTGDFENPSQVTITYSAAVAEDQLEALTEALQERFDALEIGYGSFSMELPNIATFGGDIERDGHIDIGGNLPEPPVPAVDEAFDKTSDISAVNITPAEDGALDPPLDITYTFDVDLSQWDGEAADGYLNDDDFTLDRNVVISDSLPEQAAWDLADEEFISGMDLTEATAFDGDAAAFADDSYVGQYAVVGQNLYINVGSSSDTDVEISAKALINTIAGLTGDTDGEIERFELQNHAEFIFSNDKDPYGSHVTVTLSDRGDGVSDANTFSKTPVDGDEPIYITSGESATVDYRFRANHNWSAAVDVTESYIVDHRDPNIFDFSDLDQAVESISGNLHEGAVEFDESHFDLSVNDAGNLVIALNDAGIALIDDSWAEPTAPYVVDIALNTVPVTGKQTLSIENNATLHGSADEALYWSETTSEASSFGDEAEVRKTIRDTENAQWTQNLRAEMDEDGQLIRDEIVYNLAFIPHGNYNAVTISPVVDELPDEVEFVGFVTDDNVDSGADPVEGPVDIGGNLEAVYDAESHSVTVQNQEGQLLSREDNISANVLVQIQDFEENQPVLNAFGNSSATYTPSDGYPISVVKVDATDEEMVINDPEARFNVLDVDDNVVVEGAFVEEGQLRVLDEDGETTGLVVEEPGTYYVEETVAPEGYELSTERMQVTVNEDGSSNQVTFVNDPLPTYALGDYVWIDSNRDGIQDDDEDPLEGVTVILEEADSGEELDRTATDANGRYIFDELYADEYKVRFVLTDQQREQYTFTQYRNAEADIDEDSNAGSSGYTQRITLGDDNPSLVSNDDYEFGDVLATEGIDPTWDAGVVKADFAVGDYVWIDEDRNGVQNDDEPALEGVTVVLYDGAGDEVDRTETDENGRYIFDNLPRGEYQVGFELTEEQAELYEFTGYTAGNDVRWDSDAGEDNRSAVFTLDEHNSNLVRDYQHQDVSAYYGIDPTWDAGVVRVEYAVGDYVWIDSNDNGVQDDGEEPLEGVTVVLYDGAGDELDRTETDENGRYLFDNLTSGDYQVGFELTDEQARQYNFTSYTAGDDAAADSDAGQDDRSEVFRLDRHNEALVSDADYEHATVTASEGVDPTWDAGVVEKTYAIGDYVWIDENRDGIQDEGEEPLEDVTVVLYDGEGNELDRTETSQDGRYVFDQLSRGEYQVGFELTDEQRELFNFTDHTQGDAAEDSNAGDQGRSEVFELGPDSPLTSDDDYEYRDVEASEGIDPTWDAGVVRLEYAVGDYVWIDENRDGIQDEGEEPLEGVTVVLYDGEGTEVDRTETDENGRYLFDNLTYGDYQVGFELTEEQAEEYKFTEVNVGDDTAVDSDAGQEDRSEVFRLDRDNASLVADADYEHATVSASEGVDPTWDAGVVAKSYAIGDYVWIDDNRDGVQDEGEEPLEDVTVVLYDGDGNELDRTETDENGRYLFDDLNPADYEVGFELTDEQRELFEFTDHTAGDDTAVDSNAGDNGRTGTITLGPDSPLVSDEEYEHGTVVADFGIDPTWDAGVVRIEYAVGDYVWIDANNNGVQDEDENPLEGVTVVLYNGAGDELDRTETDVNGRYIFDNLPRGEYQVGFELTDEQAALYEFTDATVGDDTAVDSNAGDQDRSAVFTLGPDNASLTLDDDYEYQDVAASKGIDPTWDAGVVLLLEPDHPVDPTDPANPNDPTDPVDPVDANDPAGPADPSDPAAPGDGTDGSDETSGGSLPMTGTNLALFLAALGLALLLTGGVLYARHRRVSNS